VASTGDFLDPNTEKLKLAAITLQPYVASPPFQGIRRCDEVTIEIDFQFPANASDFVTIPLTRFPQHATDQLFVALMVNERVVNRAIDLGHCMIIPTLDFVPFTWPSVSWPVAQATDDVQDTGNTALRIVSRTQEYAAVLANIHESELKPQYKIVVLLFGSEPSPTSIHLYHAVLHEEVRVVLDFPALQRSSIEKSFEAA
jgi:hypothetical protein